ncbi:glutamate receptor -like [Olea europaea subsp. europaea]|uniref:Glutamate receptor -like n=1 Tax=Olea europaea subsp. europaea TaxID=158383 RepID=A0A8S0RPG6_OLEEU|nr:glutamate receptor -like [Olea europaea subsp. europaea]
MMEKGYVWIVSAEIAGVLDSIPSPVMLNMQGVIGFKNNYEDTSSHCDCKSYREIALWSPEYGFFEDQMEYEEMKKEILKV